MADLSQRIESLLKLMEDQTKDTTGIFAPWSNASREVWRSTPALLKVLLALLEERKVSRYGELYDPWLKAHEATEAAILEALETGK